MTAPGAQGGEREQAGTKMLRRSDVINIVMAEIADQWNRRDEQVATGDSIGAAHTRSRLDALRFIRSRLFNAKCFVVPEYAPAAGIPRGAEFAERVRLAGEATNAPNEADVAMHRLLSDLHVPLEDLQEAELAEAAA